MRDGKDIDIMKNVKIVEWLKCELLSSVAGLFQLLQSGIKNTKEDMLDLISNIILLTYLLGKRLGLSYESIDLKVEDKIKLGLIEEHQVEKWYGDLSELHEYYNTRR
ncbi:MazG-like family protein [Sporanaerobacter acetigenes]|uniref:MazG-like family protein n=1 Tax=Sporanaerobacter acetigenes DSM 13106 TaxID=1123281 RepID=A0A1M5VY36_9FIRM|nr:MazG-like family protein [Sporanaerobacter acetigenes]SHH79914.1 MazG-like family protein [Sporanaerobacter acetigenes DSM 13106]